MALYTVTNLTEGTVVLPPPLGIRLNRYQSAKISAPAGMAEANMNRKYSAITKLVQSGVIRIQTEQDHRIDNNIEVPTVSMLQGGGGGSAEPTTFDADCPADILVGDLVCLSGSNVDHARTTSFQERAVGCVVLKTSITRAKIQSYGMVSNVYTDLIPGTTYYLGVDGRLASSPPLPAPDDSLFVQIMGMAVNTNMFLLQPNVPVRRRG